MKQMIRFAFLLPVAWCSLACTAADAATITQNFEDGEDTSNWNSTWTGTNSSSVNIVDTFLDQPNGSEFGGENAGYGDSGQQQYMRAFRNNTAGLDVTLPYTITLYVQLDSFFDAAASGEFQILDGSFGSESTANIRAIKGIGGTGPFAWEARTGPSPTSWIDLEVDLIIGEPYRVQFVIDPVSQTYDVSVSQVNRDGTIISGNAGGATGLGFGSSNVINNHNQGQLVFYELGSAGTAQFRVDNINIESVPEPASAVLLLGGLGWMAMRRVRAERGRHVAPLPEGRSPYRPG